MTISSEHRLRQVAQAIRTVDAVVELVGAATAHDRLLGRLLLLDPALVELVAAAELSHLDAEQ